MGNTLFIGQTNAPIKLFTDIDPVGATSAQIRFKKPNGTTGTWAAVAVYRTLTYNPIASDLDIEGWWQVEAFFIKDGKNHFGNTEKFYVKTPIV